MNALSRNKLLTLLAAVCLVVGVIWIVRERPAVINVVSRGPEVNGFSSIELDVSCGRFSRCVFTCFVNGQQSSRFESPNLKKASVNVLTGSEAFPQPGADAEILFAVAVGDRIAVNTPTKKIKLFECIDDLNQRWEQFVVFLR